MYKRVYILLVIVISFSACSKRTKSNSKDAEYDAITSFFTEPFFLCATPAEKGYLPLEILPIDGNMYVQYKKNGKPLGKIPITYSHYEKEGNTITYFFDEIVNGKANGKYALLDFEFGYSYELSYTDNNNREYTYYCTNPVFQDNTLLKNSDISKVEKWLYELKMEEDESSLSWNSYNDDRIRYLTYLVNFNPKTIEYPFPLLSDNYGLDIVSSDDGNLRFYRNAYYIERNYWLQAVIAQYRDNEAVYTINDFDNSYLLRESEPDEEFKINNVKIETMQLDNKTYYLVEVALLHYRYLRNSESDNKETNLNILRLYSIENGELVSNKLFNAGKSLLNEILISYDGREVHDDAEDGIADFNLFRYSTETKSLYVPLIDGLNMTDKYLLYQWDGKYFTYKGIKKQLNEIQI